MVVTMPNPGKPSRLAVVSGTREADDRPGRRRSGSSGRADDALTGEAPAWLTDEGKREWRRLVGYAASRPGWLETADRALLASYCAWWSTFVEAAEDVAERGPLVAGRSSADSARDDDAGLVKNRALSAMSDATTQLRQLAAALGLSAWHRQRMDVPQDDSGANSDLLTG